MRLPRRRRPDVVGDVRGAGRLGGLRGRPPPDNHGWHGETVEATEVAQRPVIVRQWQPVPDEPDIERPHLGAIDSLASIWEESGTRTSVAGEYAAEWIVQHADEVARLHDDYLNSEDDGR